MYIFRLYSNITCFSYISMFPLIYLCLLTYSQVIVHSGTSICFHIYTYFLIYLVIQTHMDNTCLNVNIFTYLYSNIITYNHYTHAFPFRKKKIIYTLISYPMVQISTTPKPRYSDSLHQLSYLSLSLSTSNYIHKHIEAFLH